MYRFFEGGASTYSASYYRSRMGYYGFLSLMVGCLQVALGEHAITMSCGTHTLVLSSAEATRVLTLHALDCYPSRDLFRELGHIIL